MSEGKGNGADLGAIYGAMLALSGELKAIRAEMATKADLAALRSEVAAYHGSVVGHGLMLTEHEQRLGRLERGEPPPKAA